MDSDLITNELSLLTFLISWMFALLVCVLIFRYLIKACLWMTWFYILSFSFALNLCFCANSVTMAIGSSASETCKVKMDFPWPSRVTFSLFRSCSVFWLLAFPLTSKIFDSSTFSRSILLGCWWIYTLLVSRTLPYAAATELKLLADCGVLGSDDATSSPYVPEALFCSAVYWDKSTLSVDCPCLGYSGGPVEPPASFCCSFWFRRTNTLLPLLLLDFKACRWLVNSDPSSSVRPISSIELAVPPPDLSSSAFLKSNWRSTDAWSNELSATLEAPGCWGIVPRLTCENSLIWFSIIYGWFLENSLTFPSDPALGCTALELILFEKLLDSFNAFFFLLILPPLKAWFLFLELSPLLLIDYLRLLGESRLTSELE